MQRLYTPDEALSITPDELMKVPFFNSSAPVPSLLVDPTNAVGLGSAFAVTNQNQILAEMIPALSFAAGANRLTPLGDDGNFDMNGMENGWPASLHDPNALITDPWRHGDYRAAAYLYTYKMFDKIAKELGELDQ